MKSIVPVIYDHDTITPISGAVCRLNTGPDEWVAGTTIEDGTTDLQVFDELQNTQFEITAEGYEPYGLSINLGLKGNLQLRVGIGADPSRPEDLVLPSLIRVLPPIVVSTNLTVSGRFFLLDGRRTFLNGITWFQALRYKLDGKDLGPYIRESVEYGFNMWRIFLTGSKYQNWMFDLSPTEPGYTPALTDLVAELSEAGIVSLLTCYQDNQDLKLSASFWTDVCNTVNSGLRLVSGGNEWSKNGWYPGDLVPPTNNIWSRGSDVGDVAPFKPVGSFMEFHPRRDWPKSEMDATASPLALYTEYGYPQIPLIFDEPPRMGRDGSDAVYLDPEVCWRFGRVYGAELAGAVFHNRDTQEGKLFAPETAACADKWSEGVG